ncbi:Carbonyl reductase [NADPH] 1 [Papilio xuthus]|uniref:Carbonyl reductase [NADPH] 1 n=1 Tax=Papilio xuthus TaxID=66420 RepID=A0A194PYP0_PAPXU|nr:Carbonyl reductase [NADPH] 1 [Papilio xuthus]
MSSKVAVVTGSNKGIGLSIVKGLCKRFTGIVYLTSRDIERGNNAIEDLRKQGLFPRYHQLDVTDRESVLKFKNYLQSKYGGIDILVNNAGVAVSEAYPNFEENQMIIDTNYKSILTIQELIFPLIRDNGRILNISSDCGHLSNIKNKYWIDRLSSRSLNMEDIQEFIDWFLKACESNTFRRDDIADDGSFAAYRVAKVALSAATILQQKELQTRNISVNSMHPGLVRTDMSRHIGFLSADEAAVTPLHLVLDAPDSLKGAYVWFDGKLIDWYNYNSDCYFKRSSYLQLLAEAGL